MRGKNYSLILFILLAFGLLISFLFILRNKYLGGTNYETNNKPNITLNRNKTLTKNTQAWIYPGEPSCDALQELADTNFDVAKIEFFTLDDNGNIKLISEEEFGCNSYTSENVRKIKEASNYQYITVSSDHLKMRELFKDEVKMKVAIDAINNLALKENFEGAEIDFEDFSAWTDVDYTNYKKFVQNLGEKLSENNKKLLLDVPPITPDTQRYYKFDYSDFSGNNIEALVIMAYDYQYDFGVGTPISPSSWVDEVAKYALEKLPEEKIVMGVANYGYVGTSGKYDARIKTYAQISKLIDISKASSLDDSFEHFVKDGTTFYAFTTSEDLRKKIDFINSLGITRISIWHLGGNPTVDL